MCRQPASELTYALMTEQKRSSKFVHRLNELVVCDTSHDITVRNMLGSKMQIDETLDRWRVNLRKEIVVEVWSVVDINQKSYRITLVRHRWLHYEPTLEHCLSQESTTLILSTSKYFFTIKHQNTHGMSYLVQVWFEKEISLKDHLVCSLCNNSRGLVGIKFFEQNKWG